MECQSLFSEKSKKKYFKMMSAEIFTQHSKNLYKYENDLWCLNTWVNTVLFHYWVQYQRT